MVEHVFGFEARATLEIADIAEDADAVAAELSSDLGRSVRGYRVAYDGESHSGLPDPLEADVLVVAVPADEVPRACSVARSLQPGALVFDVTSEKVAAVEALLASAPDGVSVIGTHPLFGPAVDGIEGQTVVVCETPKTDPASRDWLCALLERQGAIVMSATPEEHDHLMSYVQVLTHFVYLSLADTYGKLGVPMARVLDFQTPPFLLQMAFMARLLNPAQLPVNADIQVTARLPEVRSAFADAARELAARLEGADHERALAEIHRIASSISGGALEYAKAASDQAINNRRRVARQLYRCRSNDTPCALVDTKTDEVIPAVIDEITPQELVIRRVALTTPGSERVALAYNDESRAAAEALGYRVEERKSETLKRAQLDILSRDEFEVWKAGNLAHHEVRANVTIRADVDHHTFASTLALAVPAVVAVDVVNRTETDHGVRVDLLVTIMGDRSAARGVEELVDLARRLGAR